MSAHGSLRVLVVDDEAPARARLLALLADEAGVERVGEAGDGEAALAACAALHPDLVLLDVAMPGMDGIAVAEALQEQGGLPLVVFCTAYDQHAATAFDVDAVDFLRKPVRADRLQVALQRARQRLAQRAQAAAQAPAHLVARLAGGVRRIELDDVRWLQAEDKYVVVHHRGGEVLLETSLAALEAQYGARFLRIHRNCLVARDELQAVRRQADGRALAVLRDGVELEVSRRNLPHLRDWLESR